MTRGTAACVLAVALAAATAGARGPQQPYRGRTDLVSVYATVTDKTGRLVPDLKVSDFEVKDEGKTQKIEFFSNDLQPITIVVMLDRSGSMAENFSLVQDAAEQFVRKLLPDDKARIGSFSKAIVISPPAFTSNPDTLVQIIRHGMQDVGPSPVWTAVDRSITALLQEEGRRVVLIFSDGHDHPEPGQVVTELKDIGHRATYDEVMVYAIGLANSDDLFASWPFRRSGGPFGPSTRKEKTIKPDPGLRRLAELTGGGYFELEWGHNLGATFARVADELHRQYWLAFVPRKLDDDTHDLEVKVKQGDLTVRARKSYIASAR